MALNMFDILERFDLKKKEYEETYKDICRKIIIEYRKGNNSVSVGGYDWGKYKKMLKKEFPLLKLSYKAPSMTGRYFIKFTEIKKLKRLTFNK